MLEKIMFLEKYQKLAENSNSAKNFVYSHMISYIFWYKLRKNKVILAVFRSYEMSTLESFFT